MHEPPPSGASVHPWITLGALSLLYFLVSAGTFSSLGVVLPAMVRELHWSWTEAGLGYTFLGVACGLSSLAPALMIRRIGVRWTLAAGTALLIIGFGGLALTHSAWVYELATLVIGVAFALTTTVPATYVIAELFTRRSTALGVYFTIGGLGGVAGPLLYVAIEGPTHQWRLYWMSFVVVSAVLGVLAAWATSGPKRLSSPLQKLTPAQLIEGLSDWTVRRALVAPQFYIIVGAYTMYLLINTTAHGFAVEHLTERGIPRNMAAGMLSLEALIGAGIAVVGGILGERIKPKYLLIISMVALVFGMTALAVARDYWMMLVYAIGVGIGYGLSFISSTMLLLNYFGKRANLELYSIMGLISTTAAIGPVIGGWARDTVGSFSGVFLLCSLATLAMLGATVFMTPPTPDRREREAAAIRGSEAVHEGA